jgi:nicotinic acid phosphoribosyltransferase
VFLEENAMQTFYHATDEEIKNGQTTDIYFSKIKQIIEAKKLDRLNALAEVTSGKLREG